MNKPAIGFGIVGCGMIARWHAAALAAIAQASGAAHLTGVADQDCARATAFAAERNAVSYTHLEYVTSLKMECAIRLLTESSESIDQIASRLGYSSTNYFISRFKKHFDMTPNVYRKLKEKEYAPE